MMFIRKHLADLDVSSKITSQEVLDAIKRLNCGKALDKMGLAAEHIINADNILAPILSSIFTVILEDGQVPQRLMDGYIVPIPKKGKCHLSQDNYRGITITNVLGKLLEHILLKRIKDQLDQKQSRLQKGFTKGCSSTNAALLVSELINEAKDNHEELYVASLDAQKAFDMVYHNSLLRKLHLAEIDQSVWRLVDSWYNNAHSAVRIDNGMSRSFKINKGVRQGGVLSTTMYKCYINDVLLNLEEQDIGAHIGDSYLGAPTCADDIFLAASNAEDLQTMLDVVEKYAANERYIIHPAKSTVLIYNAKTPDDVLQTVNPFSMNGKPVQISSTCTHLGMLRSTVKTNERVDNRIKMARKTTYGLMGAGLHGYNGVNPCLSSKLLSTYIQPRYLFGLETVNLRQEEIKQLDAYGRKILKAIQHLPDRTANEAVYLLMGEVPIQAKIERQSLILLANIARSGGIEKEIGLRQLSIKKKTSNSWFTQVDHVLSKYGLKSAIQVLLDPPSADAWKDEIDIAIWNFWQSQWITSASKKSSLRYINLDLNYKKPHHVWTSVQPNPRDVKAASIKVKLLTGTYTLQSNRARFNQYDVNPTCLLCHKEPETREHFLTRCDVFHTTRNKYLEMLQQEIVTTYDEQTWEYIRNDDHILIQCILDCTNCDILQPIPSGMHLIRIESVTRWLCAALHKSRRELLLKTES